jgi:Domain of unknown function (DUF4287)
MSFQVYIDNIKTKTGRIPEEFKKLVAKKGLLKAGVKAGEIVKYAWYHYLMIFPKVGLLQCLCQICSGEPALVLSQTGLVLTGCLIAQRQIKSHLN